MKRICAPVALAAMLVLSAPALSDQVIPDDLIVQQSVCAGESCVENENFGFDTLRLNGPVLRIHFDDTSSPATDWRIEVNDTFAGGASRFSIVDASGDTTPLTILPGAPTHALYVDGTGRIGLGTPTPAAGLHMLSANTPALRLEQTSAATFAPYIWEIGGNEANWFLRDVTGSSTEPFRVKAAAGDDALVIAAGGDVAVGHDTPAAKLHLRSDGDATLRIEDSSAERKNNRILLDLVNNGASQIAFRDSDTGTDWRMQNFEDTFRLNKAGTGVAEFTVDAAGNLTLAGAVTENSDRGAKTGIVPVDPAAILAKVAALPVAEWAYSDTAGVRHIGPMAQDFHALFGLGASDTGISTLDTSGVALAAIQALAAQNAAQQRLIEALRAADAARRMRIDRLERRLEALGAAPVLLWPDSGR